jgi:hypothetical protein
MQFPFSFDLVETSAEDGRVHCKYLNKDSGEYLQVNHDGDISEIISHLKRMNRMAKRQRRFEKKLKRWTEKHTEKDQD